jgi:hypothetical protein
MSRVVLVGGDPVGLEQVCHALDALPREVEPASDLGHSGWTIVNCGHHLPAGTRLARRTRQGISGRAEQAVELKDPHPELTEGIPSWRPTFLRARLCIDSILSS